jgi:autotransporter-associated beta strand protein
VVFLQKLGAGTWFLSGGAGNTFSGGVWIRQGIVSVASMASLGSGTLGIGSSSQSGNFYYTGSGETTATVVNLAGTTAPATIYANNASGLLKFTSNFTATGAGSKTLTLRGTGGAEVAGSIADNSVVNITSVTKNDAAGTWTLSGSNTYSGATTVSAGTLVGIGNNAFGSTSGISIASAGILSLRGDSSTNFVKPSDSSAISVTTTANGSTINVDQATVAGTSAKTMTLGTLLINTAATNTTNFTGSNNTSLSVGAVTTGNSASGTETFNNTISGGGSLTLASIAVNRTGTPIVAFTGDGNTIVTGNITQVASVGLTQDCTAPPPRRLAPITP